MGIQHVVWDDFRGGYFVGPSVNDQPKNTWTGDNVWVDASTGDLIPMHRVRYPASPTYSNDPFYTTAYQHPVRYSATQFAWFHLESNGTQWRGWNAALSGSTVTVARTASAVTMSNATQIGGTPALASFSGALHIFAGDGGTSVARYNVEAGTIGVTTVTAIGSRMALWNERMVSWGNLALTGANGNRLYFSDPSAFTTWPAINYIEIGGNSSPIINVVVTPQALLVGKGSGWYEVRGVLGSSASVTQIATLNGPSESYYGAGTTNSQAWAVAGGTTIYDGQGAGVVALALAGVLPRPLNSRPVDGTTNAFALSSRSGLIVGYQEGSTGDDAGWIFDSLYNRWHRYTLPATITDGNDVVRLRWSVDPAGISVIDAANSDIGGTNIIGLVQSSIDTSRVEVVLFEDGLHANDPPDGESCTVLLAEQSTPAGGIDRIAEVWVEVVAGENPPDVIELAVRVQAAGIIDRVNDPEPWSQTYRWEAHGNQLTAGASYIHRFRPTDLPAATIFRPEVTIQGLKLRRVVLAVDRDSIRVS